MVIELSVEKREGLKYCPRRSRWRAPPCPQTGSGTSRRPAWPAGRSRAATTVPRKSCQRASLCRLTRAPEKYAERPGALPGARRRDAVGLMPETQLVDELPIAFQVYALQVVQQAAALADHFQEAALPMVVLGVRPEVIGQAVDPLGEQR